jgi:hypothetical protein
MSREERKTERLSRSDYSRHGIAQGKWVLRVATNVLEYRHPVIG